MKALILNGARKGGATLAPVVEALSSELIQGGYEPTMLALSEHEIASCRGDFGCWVKTPGECVIDDVARDISCGMLNSDLLALLTPVTFGGFSSELKKVLDRVIGLIMPQFKMVHGEIHHKKRYKRYPSLFAVGVMPEADEQAATMFAYLLGRVALNFHSPWHGAVVLSNGMPPNEIRERIRRALAEKEAER